MAKASTRSKMKYNRDTYRRYEFNLGIDSRLNALVERYKTYPDANLSSLIKTLLCGYFGISKFEADLIHCDYIFDSTAPGGKRLNNELDKYFVNS
jgi:hypothetical protein